MASTTWFVSGSNRGMGLQWVTQILAMHGTTVIAGSRPGDEVDGLEKLRKQYKKRLSIVDLEVTSVASVQAAAAAVMTQHPNGVDYLINNAGILGNYAAVSDQSIDEFIQVLMINVVGTFSVTKSFVPLLRKGHRKTIINISSNAASLSRNASYIHQPGVSDASLALSYRVAKVGVNMETTVVANELKSEGFTVVSLDPGNVSTGLWEYLMKHIFSPTCAMVTERGLQPRKPDQTPEESVHDMLQLTLKLTAKDTGKFILYNGEELPW